MPRKRPYSTQFTARQNPRRYLLSGIPPSLWDKVRTRARREGLAVRTVILSLAEQWVERPEGQPLAIAPIEPEPEMNLQELAAAAAVIAKTLARQARRGGA
jgi:hypothetical protein